MDDEKSHDESAWIVTVAGKKEFADVGELLDIGESGGGRMTVALFTRIRLPCVVRRCGVGIGVGIVARRLLAIRFRGRDVRI